MSTVVLHGGTGAFGEWDQFGCVRFVSHQPIDRAHRSDPSEARRSPCCASEIVTRLVRVARSIVEFHYLGLHASMSVRIVDRAQNRMLWLAVEDPAQDHLNPY